MEPRVDNRLEVQQTQKLSQNLQTAIHLLTLDLDGLSDYVSQAIQENPALEYVPPKKSAQDYAMRVRTRYRGSRGEYSGDSQTASPETPLADLEQQLRLSDLDTWTFRAADSVLHLLTNRGYFEQDLNEFAAEAGVDPGTAEAALKAVQALEPAGIGARTVEECLCLQLRDRPDADPLCRELICHHLEDISRGKIKEIAKATGATQARIRACVETIRSLNPSPCSLREEAVQYIMPEFSVEKGPDGKLSILFHNDYYPSFRQDVNFMRLTETLQGEEETYARRMQTSAAQLIRAVEMRQATMEKLARIIVREQQPFFLGQYSLLPLRIVTVAEEIGVHEATVYRALQGKYLDCDRGTFPLSHFFQREISGGASVERVREIIQELCRENGKLSDRAITEMLAQRGISLSRRTVAKYRAQMDIDSSFRRGAQGGKNER